MRYWKLALLLLPLLAVNAAAAAELGTRKSVDRGVTVSITPRNIGTDATTWDFAVVLDTHSQDLGDDLTKSATLFDAGSGQYTPVSWEGAGPGGHHREGVLKFKSISPHPQVIELRIKRPGESTPRLFRWELK